MGKTSVRLSSVFPNPFSSPSYSVLRTHLVQRPPACLRRLRSVGPVGSGWAWSQQMLSGRAWALGGHLREWAMYVAILWPEPGRIEGIKHVISGLSPLWRGKVLCLSRSESADRASVQRCTALRDHVWKEGVRLPPGPERGRKGKMKERGERPKGEEGDRTL